MNLLTRLLRYRYGLVTLQLLLMAGISFLTRLVLFIASWSQLPLRPLQWVAIFLVGLGYDLVAGLYFSLPLVLYCLLMRDRWFHRRWNRILVGIYFFLVTYILLFNAVAEYFFWDEFQVRYNFIAVDYLIYTNEVIGNIRQSYPMPLILLSLLAATALVSRLLRRPLQTALSGSYRFSRRWQPALLLLILPAASFFWVSDSWRVISSNKYINELAGNGMYQFGAAFRKNELDYNEFYATRDEKAAFAQVREMLQTPGATFTSQDPYNITRTIRPEGEPHRWNVVLITVESFSAEYLQFFGAKPISYPEIGKSFYQTPHMDSLISQSIFFSNMYSSGTRTVRGLEALSMALPPTPGQSIVKRLPTREDLLTLGNVLKGQGYDTKFIYGGNSFFDNMGAYFGDNGYQVVDRKNVPDSVIHHETAWGVCDEDMFSVALREMDKSYQSGKPFFQQIMTVSHHRPYTYPAGRIPIPDKVQSSHAALTYTDYALDKFLRAARNRPYFNNTVFVIVADHCLNSSGRSDMPINRYHIPCWIYAPALLKPRIEERLTAQADLAPTLMGLLNLPYTSKFFGYDIFRLEKGRERLFMVTYQQVAYVHDGKMVVLSPQKKVEMFRPDFTTGEVTRIPLEDTLVNQAISYFQTASYLFKNDSLKK